MAFPGVDTEKLIQMRAAAAAAIEAAKQKQGRQWRAAERKARQERVRIDQELKARGPLPPKKPPEQE